MLGVLFNIGTQGNTCAEAIKIIGDFIYQIDV